MCSNDINHDGLPEFKWDPDDERKSLDDLHLFACKKAAGVRKWYEKDRKRKKRISILLRWFYLFLASLGALCPVSKLAFNVTAKSPQIEMSFLCNTLLKIDINGFGFFLLAIAAAIFTFDKQFGYSTAWMRDIQAANDVSKALDSFKIRWESSLVTNYYGIDRTVPEQVTEGNHHMIGLVETFVDRINDIMMNETQTWIREFKGVLSKINQQIDKTIEPETDKK